MQCLVWLTCSHLLLSSRSLLLLCIVVQEDICCGQQQEPTAYHKEDDGSGVAALSFLQARVLYEAHFSMPVTCLG